ncbi:hypothetical protein QCA50_020212 [Cerrena zonata]|uniref:Uncharacterized protein n=1 Tax=Cerrena zonata TaxID=2478898 RepID=A0AAW0F9U7_9APHY
MLSFRETFYQRRCLAALSTSPAKYPQNSLVARRYRSAHMSLLVTSSTPTIYAKRTHKDVNLRIKEQNTIRLTNRTSSIDTNLPLNNCRLAVVKDVFSRSSWTSVRTVQARKGWLDREDPDKRVRTFLSNGQRGQGGLYTSSTL